MKSCDSKGIFNVTKDFYLK